MTQNDTGLQLFGRFCHFGKKDLHLILHDFVRPTDYVLQSLQQGARLHSLYFACQMKTCDSVSCRVFSFYVRRIV